jgi:hypothetical protein
MTAFSTVLLALAASLVVGGQGRAAPSPPTQPLQSGSFLRAEDYRVARIAYRLAVAGRQHCESLLPLTGLSLHYLPEYDASNRGEAARLYGIDRGPGVLSVVGDSPAARAGLLAGDVLLGSNGVAFPSGEAMVRETAGKKWREAAEQLEGRLEDQLRIGPVRLSILRAARPLEVEVPPLMGCPIRTRLARSNQANAFADGRTAIMTTRMLKFVRSDDELAVILAHEAAHNILGHPARLKDEKVPKGVLANFGKNAKRVRRTEEEADRLGLKLLWSAGYDTAAVMPFWQRLYRAFDPVPTPKLFNRHPSLAARERIVQETLAELGQAQPRPSP